MSFKTITISAHKKHPFLKWNRMNCIIIHTLLWLASSPEPHIRFHFRVLNKDWTYDGEQKQPRTWRPCGHYNLTCIQHSVSSFTNTLTCVQWATMVQKWGRCQRMSLHTNTGNHAPSHRRCVLTFFWHIADISAVRGRYTKYQQRKRAHFK